MARRSTRQIREARQQSRRQARIRAAVEREALGTHPEQAMIRWEPTVYMPGDRNYVRLPGIKIEVLVGSEEELRWVQQAMMWGIENWIQKEEESEQ